MLHYLFTIETAFIVKQIRNIDNIVYTNILIYYVQYVDIPTVYVHTFKQSKS